MAVEVIKAWLESGEPVVNVFSPNIAAAQRLSDDCRKVGLLTTILEGEDTLGFSSAIVEVRQVELEEYDA